MQMNSSDGIPYRNHSRRSALHVGCLSMAGAFAGLLPNAAVLSNAPQSQPKARAKRCILLWLDGGPSHLETWDPKPDAPIEVRGPFRAIPTRTPGVVVSEHLPACAKLTEHLAIVRSMTSPLGEHGIANHYLMTGYQPSSQVQYPSFGAIVSRSLHNTAAHQPSRVPGYVIIPESTSSMGSGFLGLQYEPLETGGDPSHPEFAMRGLQSNEALIEQRKRRREFLQRLNARAESDSPTIHSSPIEQAFDLIEAGTLASGLRIQEEPETVRNRYGRRSFGQACLLARRLAERGVTMTTVVLRGWDTHDNLTLALRDGFSGAQTPVGLIPTFDTAFSALIEDLQQRGLLADTLIVAMGEFGRTPKINPRGGRDHWPRAFSAVLAGAGITGQVIGSTDRTGESPTADPVTPGKLVATILSLLGIDPSGTLHTPDGRPIRLGSTTDRIDSIL